MNVNKVLTKDYENVPLRRRGENKPNTNPNKANFPAMDPYSGKPLVYRKTDDSFLLYSVGPNFKDDGGEVERKGDGRVKTCRKRWGDEGDAVFWPVSK